MNIHQAARLLDIRSNDDEKSIKTKYRALQKKWHPDLYMNQGQAKIEEANKKSQEINAALEIVEDYIKKYGLSSFQAKVNNVSYTNTSTPKSQFTEKKKPAAKDLYWNHQKESFNEFYSKIKNNPTYYFYIASFRNPLYEDFMRESKYINVLRYCSLSDYLRKSTKYTYEYTPNITITNKNIKNIDINTPIKLTENVDGYSSFTYSIKTNTNIQIGVLNAEEALFYEAIIKPLIKNKNLIYNSAKIISRSPLKVEIIYETPNRHFEVDGLIERIKKLYDFEKSLIRIYNNLKDKDYEVVPKSKWVRGFELKNYFSVLKRPFEYDEVESIFGYQFSSNSSSLSDGIFTWDKYYRNASGDMKIFDFQMDTKDLRQILKICFTLNSFISSKSKSCWNSIINSENSTSYHYILHKNIVALIKFEKDITINQENDNSFLFKVRFIRRTDYDSIHEKYKRKEKIIYKNEEERKDSILKMESLTHPMRQRLKLVGILTQTQLREEGVYNAWKKVFLSNNQLRLDAFMRLAKAIYVGKRFTKQEKTEFSRFVSKTIAEERAKKEALKEKKIETLKDLPNIGEKFEEKLNRIGILSIDDLNSHTTFEIWDKLYEIDNKIDIIEIYSIEGAKRNIKTVNLSQETKKLLKDYVRDKKNI